jgi:hypothetical protein
MVGIEKVHHIDTKVLLQPEYIRISSVEDLQVSVVPVGSYLDDSRIRQYAAELPFP